MELMRRSASFAEAMARQVDRRYSLLGELKAFGGTRKSPVVDPLLLDLTSRPTRL